MDPNPRELEAVQLAKPGTTHVSLVPFDIRWQIPGFNPLAAIARLDEQTASTIVGDAAASKQRR